DRAVRVEVAPRNTGARDEDLLHRVDQAGGGPAVAGRTQYGGPSVAARRRLDALALRAAAVFGRAHDQAVGLLEACHGARAFEQDVERLAHVVRAVERIRDSAADEVEGKQHREPGLLSEAGNRDVRSLNGDVEIDLVTLRGRVFAAQREESEGEGEQVRTSSIHDRNVYACESAAGAAPQAAQGLGPDRSARPPSRRSPTG